MAVLTGLSALRGHAVVADCRRPISGSAIAL
jgi:hypothetical protein